PPARISHQTNTLKKQCATCFAEAVFLALGSCLGTPNCFTLLALRQALKKRGSFFPFLNESLLSPPEKEKLHQKLEQ
ncbi:MAG: hypothetical protein ACWGMZ_02600, partial [Thermoguttaceae bacterium]